MDIGANELRYLRLLSEKYPSIRSASAEIIKLTANLDLPKGTEHFISDIHGEFEAFRVEVELKNMDGVFRTGKKGKFTIWAAPKHGNMPVKIQCALAVGPFTGTMTAILASRS